MPTYQYACTEPSCANRFELVQSFTDPAATECPVCAGKVRKVYGSVGVVFKGSGFYRTDSRASGNGTAAKSESSASSDKPSSSSSDASSSSSSSSSSSDKSSGSSSPAAGAGSAGGSAGSKAAASA